MRAAASDPGEQAGTVELAPQAAKALRLRRIKLRFHRPIILIAEVRQQARQRLWRQPSMQGAYGSAHAIKLRREGRGTHEIHKVRRGAV